MRFFSKNSCILCLALSLNASTLFSSVHFDTAPSAVVNFSKEGPSSCFSDSQSSDHSEGLTPPISSSNSSPPTNSPRQGLRLVEQNPDEIRLPDAYSSVDLSGSFGGDGYDADSGSPTRNLANQQKKIAISRSPSQEHQSSIGHGQKLIDQISILEGQRSEIAKTLRVLEASNLAYPGTGENMGHVRLLERDPQNRFVVVESKDPKDSSVYIAFPGTNTKNWRAALASAFFFDFKELDLLGCAIKNYVLPSVLAKRLSDSPYTHAMKLSLFFGAGALFKASFDLSKGDAFMPFFICSMGAFIFSLSIYIKIMPMIMLPWYAYHIYHLKPEIERLVRKYPNAEFVGHSFGGVLAELFSLILGPKASIVSAPKIGYFWEKVLHFFIDGSSIAERRSRIIHIRKEGDALAHGRDCQNSSKPEETSLENHKLLSLLREYEREDHRCADELCALYSQKVKRSPQL